MDTEKLIGRVAVIVPLVHVFACGIYIAGYSFGFGGQVGGMFSASDFFTITIQHLASIYITGLGAPLAVLYARHRSGKPYAVDRVDATSDPEEKSRLSRQLDTIQLIIMVSALAFAAGGAILLSLQIWAGVLPFYQILIMFIWIGILPFWWSILSKVGIYGVTAEAIWISVTFTLSVFAMALQTGDRDRRMPYGELNSGRLKCKEHVILSPIGDRFLTVTSNNKRHVVNDECEDFAQFQDMPVARMEPLWPLIAEKLAPVAIRGQQRPAAATRTSRQTPPSVLNQK